MDGRLMVIDDNPGDLYLVKAALEEENDDVVVDLRTDARQALDELLQAQPTALPRAILIDLNMPRLHGHDFLLALQRNDALRHLPVLVMTSSRMDRDHERSLALGARDHVVKGMGIDAVRSCVRSLRRYWSA